LPVPEDAEARLRRCDAAPTEVRAPCRFAVARAWFDARRFERAGPLFLAVAHDPEAVDAPAASVLAVESMNGIAAYTDPPRDSCYELMAEEVPKLLFEHCAPGWWVVSPDPAQPFRQYDPPPAPAHRPRTDGACPMLHRIAADLARPICGVRLLQRMPASMETLGALADARL
jgi:hypothetical protein